MRRKLLGFIVFATFFMLLGRNLSFLPVLSFPANTADVKKEVEEYIKTKPGLYGVYFKDLKTGDSFSINDRQIFTAASVNKLPIIAALYYLDSKGEVSLDERVSIQDEDIQDYGTGSLRYQKPPQVYSLRNLARLALKESDNTAAHVLAVKIGLDRIENINREWGLTQTNMKNNKTSLRDVAILLEKIYKGEVAKNAETLELLTFMTDGDFEDRLPFLLPKNAKVYHKTGDGEGYVHDVGIIEYGDGAYFLGVFTSDIGDTEAETKRSIAEISKIVFEKLY